MIEPEYHGERSLEEMDLDALERLWRMEPAERKDTPRWGCLLAEVACLVMVAVSCWWCWQALERVMR